MQTVLFDLDGTLINHFSAIQRSIAYAQETMGLEPSDYETVRRTVGGGIRLTLTRLIGADNVDTALPLFEKHFETIMLDDVEVLPGVPWLLESLAAKGYQLGVFTNKIGDHSRALTKHLGLDRWLRATVGTVDTAYRKPDPEFTMHMLEVMDASSDETILIGDSPFDYAAAEGGCLSACYLVATGSHSVAQLEEETAANGVYANMFEVGEAVFNLQRPAEAVCRH